MNTRIFKIININNISIKKGKYTGRGPLQAARKAFNKYCVSNNIKDCDSIITLKEITPYSSHKKFSYKCSRTLLETPKVITRTKNNEIITFNVKYDISVKHIV